MIVCFVYRIDDVFYILRSLSEFCSVQLVTYQTETLPANVTRSIRNKSTVDAHCQKGTNSIARSGQSGRNVGWKPTFPPLTLSETRARPSVSEGGTLNQDLLCTSGVFNLNTSFRESDEWCRGWVVALWECLGIVRIEELFYKVNLTASLIYLDAFYLIYRCILRLCGNGWSNPILVQAKLTSGQVVGAYSQ